MFYKRLANILLFALAIGAAAFAQNRGALTIQCDQVGAQVYLNDRLAGSTTPNFSQLVPAGKYNIKVTKAGYKPYESIVTMTGGPVVINVVLESLKAAVAPPTFNLTITAQVSGAPVPNAQVSVNGTAIGLAPAAATLEAGNYAIAVAAPNYEPYAATVTVTGNTSHIANMKALTYQLTISAQAGGIPVPNAAVSVNGTALGKAPTSAIVEAGTYTVTIAAPDYEPYSAAVAVSGNTNHVAAMKMVVYRLTVGANVAGAEVYLNDTLAGTIPFAIDLSPGSYNLAVKAAGYGSYTAPLVMNGAKSVTATLALLPAQVQVKIPSQILNRAVTNPETRVEFYVDGVKQTSVSVSIPAGRHVLRLITGGLVTETTYDLKAGVVYTLEPVFSLNLK